MLPPGGGEVVSPEEADLPPEVFVSGVVPEQGEYVYPDYGPPLVGAANGTAADSSYDSRDGGQTRVKNQSGYGLCWTLISRPNYTYSTKICKNKLG